MRELADKSYRQWVEDQQYPGIDFKKLELGNQQPLWQARVGLHYRALCTKEGDDYIWFWIGSKEDAKKLY